ncbi:MAG: hypothetical protein AAFP77_01190 [Bacteroidota bacterium]
MRKMSQVVIKALPLLLMVLMLLLPEVADAQCPMCRMTAESNLANGGTEGQGLNNGIMYMLATPYILIGVIGYVWWRNRRKEDEFEVEEATS